MDVSFSPPIFGSDISCPHCGKTIPALTLTDSYLCERHGAFEAEPDTQELVHLQSGRRWRRWNGMWFRQHTHVDGIRFEIHEELDRLHAQGMRATAVTIAHRYSKLLNSYLESNHARRHKNGKWQLYGLPVSFSQEPVLNERETERIPIAHGHTAIPTLMSSPSPVKEPQVTSPPPLEEQRWSIINFELAKEAGSPPRFARFRFH
ncbi:MAG: TIGR02652 family protein [Cyanobacteria bacterium P01_E01_bin.34]